MAAFRKGRERRRAEANSERFVIEHELRTSEEPKYRKPPRKVDEDDFSLSESDEDSIEINVQNPPEFAGGEDIKQSAEVENKCKKKESEKNQLRREPNDELEQDQSATDFPDLNDSNVQSNDDIRDHNTSANQNKNDENEKLTRMLKDTLNIAKN